MNKRFDPFTDRQCRDLRNDLSESFTDVLSSRSLEPALRVAGTYRSSPLAPLYEEYLTRRLDAYGQALQRLEQQQISALLPTAALIWDLGLFFEVHEILEPAWMNASGDWKLLLQALIRSAGVYVYLEAGYSQRAAKIAAKAIPVLQRLHSMTKASLNSENLIVALQELNTTPPLLSTEQS